MPGDPARARANVARKPPQQGQGDTRIHVTYRNLLELQYQARQLSFLPRQPSQSVLNGRHGSRIRGRGLDFEELRNYLQGDDIRSIDWKVTARTGEPHVRVMTEERDRPALVVVDQRMTMYFGSRLNMKSVTAAEAAALAAFRILDQGDRIGGIVFGDQHLADFKPRRSRAALHRFLMALARANSLLSADAPDVEPVELSRVLKMVLGIAPRNHLIIVLSDFDTLGDGAELIVSGLARHNDLVLCPVTDPFADEIPERTRLFVSNGDLQADIDAGDTKVRARLASFAQGRMAEVMHWQKQFGVSVIPLTAAEATASQLAMLTGVKRR
ncbi:DUF58 domain-containing protein [Marinobacter sp. F4206]|uniref:DUF58 domain-containing protein n=1 Tax=Marinobacter sp. F4206 TaxID=2861777 RepID=UPI001C5D2025|nr:DUF58 domain-containing protein [Marinobacter sp. F4206]MBW4935550.1 DUF58 domain-containing protein [Marinobacter sp. F4206]